MTGSTELLRWTASEDEPAVEPPARQGTEGGAPLTVRLLPGAAAAELAPEWRRLEAVAPGLACSWDWTAAWLDCYGDVVPHHFAAAEVGQRFVAIALVTEGRGTRRGPFPVRTLHLGTAGEPAGETVYVEYNRLLVAPQQQVAFARALLWTLRDAPLAWDELVLDGFAPEEAAPLLAAEPAFVPEIQACPAVDLAAIRAEGRVVEELLPRGVRYDVRRSLRGLGSVEAEWAETPEHALDILEELIALHQRRWAAAGAAGAFASPRLIRFHRAIIPRLLPRGRAALYRLRNAAGTIACLYGLIEDGRFLFYQGGFNAYADPKVKPGYVAHALCMQAALDRGLTEYNFLAGEARYKRELSTTERPLVWARASRGTRIRLIDGAVRAYALGRRLRDRGNGQPR